MYNKTCFVFVLAINALGNLIIPPDANIDILKDDLEGCAVNDLYMGYAFEKEIKDEKYFDEKYKIREDCKNFKALIIQLRERLPHANKTLDKIISLLEHFKYKNIDENVSQFGKIHLINWEKKEQTIEFWLEVSMYKDAGQNKAFKQLALFALHILSLPWSNGAVERVFSQMNIVKTKLRIKMCLKSLNAILRIRYGLRRHGKCCHDYQLPTKYLALVQSFAKYMESNDEVDEIISLL